MKIMSQLFRFTLLAAATLFMFNGAIAQNECVNWTTFSPADKDKAEDAHVVYRNFMKSEDYAAAFPKWQIAYDLAPAADGERPFHYADGRTLYMDKFNKETDEAKKQEYADMVLKLYDQDIICYGKDKRDVFLLGRKAFDMFYYLRSPYVDVLKVLEENMEKGGNDVEYIVLEPYATVVAYQFSDKQMEKEAARAAYEKIMAVADHNIANHKTQKEEYKAAKERALAALTPIEPFIFDCAFFYDKLVPEYQANPNDRETYLRVYTTLVQRGCDKEDPVLAEIAAKDREFQMEELRANNKGYAANEMYKNGDFTGAVAKYREAIDEATDPAEQAKHYFSIASIQFRKLKSYGDARESARKAASLDSSFGKPYELIGDMYATTARSCGNDAWGNSLAVLAAIDKYQTAKSVDPSLAGSVNKKINNYASSKPNQETGFMMGVKNGQTATVPCWIGETVTVRY